ncbi:Phenylalanyl-tRNA synthetase beta chain [Richelia intracellularis HH01]|uniref:Phenylalanine--tRNA ligase beta subunit n=1 Tax=Richelia intracellularis HH01 TaxID=1165094 RepID=M1X1C6_9NOST|nr:phenylalanine--tRNA ligase subunit beta [Richelia intracellularis]CCH68078.1 Phenylalanyl-tRNA synthetase beta chain [Richelia intracellularis HH01]
MRISLNWLRELVEIKLNPEELAETITMSGFEVEEIEDWHTWADGVVIGKVAQCQPHPNAHKLSVCQVDVGKGELLNIICGASNVRTGIYVPVALVGTYLPKIDLKIKPVNLRGQMSYGMLCSLKELGLSTDIDGIHIFSQEHLQLGADVRPLLGLDDIILDVTSTANRSDALSMVGMAREVAALTGGNLNIPESAPILLPQNIGNLSLKISELAACPAYFSTLVRGVKIAPSPAWLKQKLNGAGINPINNIVDITNYILLEWGQPLHAFDSQRLKSIDGREKITIGVRFASIEESLKTLDGKTRKLSTQNLVITANDKPVALAGIMGGAETEIYSGTENIVLEAALFDPVVIRRSSRSSGLRSESSARYEREVNHFCLEMALYRALSLIEELAGGTIVAQEIADNRPDLSICNRSIELRLERINQVLGPVELGDNNIDELTSVDVENILTALGCKLTTSSHATWTVTIPPYRYRDLEEEIDLIEEIARLYGYERFCETLPEKPEAGYLPIDQELLRKLRASFRAEGLTELMHYSLVKPGEDKQIALNNPLFAEYSALRTDLIAGLIDAFQYNLEQGNGSLNGFEIGRVFWQEEGLQETDMIAGIMGGDIIYSHWQNSGKEEPMTWFAAKGILESVFTQMGLKVEYHPDRQDSRLHPGRTASLWLGGSKLGVFGQLHPQLRQEKDLPASVYVFQLDLDVILDLLERDEFLISTFKSYSSYPVSNRDIAFFAPISISVADIEKVIMNAGKSLLDSVELFDEYHGENVPSRQRSLAFRLTYRANDRTLKDNEVENIHNRIREALVEKFGVSLRS